MSRPTAAALLLAVVVLTFALVPIARAGAPIFSTGMISLDGIVFDPNTGSDVHLTGIVHVMTHVRFIDSSNIEITAHALLPPVDATATNGFGDTYIAHGAGIAKVPASDILVPPDPVLPNFALTLQPEGPPVRPDGPPSSPPDSITPISFILRLSLRFTEAGVLIPGSSSATVHVP
jgi:hypothetical protein